MEDVNELIHLFVRRYGLLNANCCESCCGQDVSLVQSHILYEIKRKKNPSMQSVADELGIDITTFSRQIKSLVTKGLIEKALDEEDKRVNVLSLTSEGERVSLLLRQYMEKHIERVFSFMTEFEKESVIHSLKLLTWALTKAGPCCTD
ncbi:MarR family transcriptional regulator [Candidatus Formimonas warabiya]|uniref:MarR family transcriptional regulator n=1 Tax=Formimonas warabiya TaxID=1761012 RepID=A0A3G1KMD4_FORW1|nr:MarR family transcriptional regulator [Candidatus Formimonas warabiya]